MSPSHCAWSHDAIQRQTLEINWQPPRLIAGDRITANPCNFIIWPMHLTVSLHMQTLGLKTLIFNLSVGVVNVDPWQFQQLLHLSRSVCARSNPSMVKCYYNSGKSHTWSMIHSPTIHQYFLTALFAYPRSIQILCILASHAAQIQKRATALWGSTTIKVKILWKVCLPYHPSICIWMDHILYRHKLG